MSNCPISIWTQFYLSIDRTLSGAITPGQSRTDSNGNQGLLHIPQSSSIIGTSPSDCLVSYPRHSLGESYPSAEKQSVYSTAPADWAIVDLGTIVKSKVLKRSKIGETSKAVRDAV